MNTIKINSRIADMSPNTQVQVQMTNPHLNYETIIGNNYSLPDLPTTPNNKSIFGFFHLPQAQYVLNRYAFQHEYNGHLIREGIYVLTEASPSAYKGSFVDNLSEFFGDAQTTTLNQLDFGTIALPMPLTPTIQHLNQSAACFPTVLNPQYYGTNNANFNGRVNDYVNGAYTAATPRVPMFFLPYIIRRIAELTGISISGPFLDHPTYRNLILYNTRALDGEVAITINRHLPDLRPDRFLLELRKLFNLRFDINVSRRTLDIGFWEDTLALPATLNWSDKAVNEAQKIAETNTRLQLAFSVDSNDALTKDKPEDLTDFLSAGSGGIAPITSLFSPVLVDAATQTLRSSQQGVTSQFAQLNQKFSPRLAFYTGLKNNLPTASHTMGNYSLLWHGTKGLVANHWQRTSNNRSTRFYLKQPMLLNETDIATIDWGRKIHINGVDYLLADVNIELPVEKEANCLFIRV